ncbi:alpha/beta-hydrolase [Annulohypoxylon maeteangense]|uniref:alpha/beta-hydrolase n=1 Tax=Annulohypoxylon maeteangense TaxID=1927788 RepID=UPI00200729C6|nr:alpha/beta-hydrolase [Annulohypoxylon maeteangense]KAI0886712.1 alpha/beta-hydrolase [Annulohypoxylon maeteangense]
MLPNCRGFITTFGLLSICSGAEGTSSQNAIITNSSLPVVDLGYECHQAISLNETGGYYNFSNIRYAEPPIGNLRFRAPVEPPSQDKCVITDGSIGRVCPKSSGNWTIIASQFAKSYLAGLPFNYDLAESLLSDSPAAVSSDPRTTEDCLFLDVIAPRSAFAGNGPGLPVLIWVYGGGYSSGEKTGNGKFNPAGLLAASSSDSGFVFVAINYRLGAFGWLGGDEVGADGTRNAGLYDQRLAFKWVQKHIHLFGGDKDRVTVMGASAGAGSIMHHITSFGGVEEAPGFNQAILFSPAFLPAPTDYIPTMSFDDLMQMTNVTSLDDLRSLSSETLIDAHALQIYSHAPYGSNMYGPSVDGSFVPALPGQLLAKGSFHKNISIMVSHNTLEGLIFTKPSIKTTEDYLDMLREAMPTISNETLGFISNTLYPAVFNGTYGYTDQFQRALVTIQDSTIVCNTRYLAGAMSDRAYGIQFAVPPGIHGEETAYIFQNGATSGVAQNVADNLQQYIVSFVMNSVPTDVNGLRMPLYGNAAQLTSMDASGSTVVKDDTANSRCSWWQQALYA